MKFIQYDYEFISISILFLFIFTSMTIVLLSLSFYETRGTYIVIIIKLPESKHSEF